ncbi:MAG: hypothetical protein FWD17_14550 [Polyangiaceae bacterium]|nr:hypothetical protein [Polyangiaceae bacterium]
MPEPPLLDGLALDGLPLEESLFDDDALAALLPRLDEVPATCPSGDELAPVVDNDDDDDSARNPEPALESVPEPAVLAPCVEHWHNAGAHSNGIAATRRKRTRSKESRR